MRRATFVKTRFSDLSMSYCSIVARSFSRVNTLPTYGLAGRGSIRRRAAYLEAVMRGYLQDYSELSRFFAESLAG